VPTAQPSLARGQPLLTKVPSVTVPQLIRQRARELAGKTALIEATSGRSYSYGDLDHLIGRFATGIVSLGLRPGDTVIMFMPNLPEWAIASFGAMCAGGVVSGVNSMCSSAELAHQLRGTRGRFVVTIPEFLPTVRAATADLGDMTIVALGDAPATMSFASVVACGGKEPSVNSGPETLAALPYSSGTSGLPKAVMLTHRNIVTNVSQIAQAISWPESGISLAFLPMFHIYGFTVVLLGGLMTGMTLVTIPRFEPELFLKTLQDHRVTHLAVVPPILQFLTEHPLVDNFDLSSLQVIGSGAAPLSASLEHKAAERLKCDVGQGYGMTESSGVIAASYPGRFRHGSSGELLPDTQAKVVDPVTSAELERRVSGEIWFRGPQAFQGYLNDSQMTAETITADGWVRTGDIGYIDNDGYLTITDRLKELIKVKGFQVAPAELEALLYTHPSVADAAVIGRADQRDGEMPVAYVVARKSVDREELKNWVALRVSEYKQLRDVVFCDAIPRSPSGKILRRSLRAQDASRASDVSYISGRSAS
jgi:acyl-CoA synthetase (AMP-forming)/AMP-acid ligase II